MKFENYDTFKPIDMTGIKEIPFTWNIRRVKDLGTVVLGKMLDNKPDENKYKKYYLKSKNIQWFSVDVTSTETMYFTHDELKSYRVKKDDLLLSEGGEVGKTSLWNNELEECYIQNSVHKISLYKQELPK